MWINCWNGWIWSCKRFKCPMRTTRGERRDEPPSSRDDYHRDPTQPLLKPNTSLIAFTLPSALTASLIHLHSGCRLNDTHVFCYIDRWHEGGRHSDQGRIATRRVQGQHGNTLEKQHVFAHMKDQHSLPVPNSLLLLQLLNHSIWADFPCLHGQISGSSVLHSADKTR